MAASGAPICPEGPFPKSSSLSAKSCWSCRRAWLFFQGMAKRLRSASSGSTILFWCEKTHRWRLRGADLKFANQGDIVRRVSRIPRERQFGNEELGDSYLFPGRPHCVVVPGREHVIAGRYFRANADIKELLS